MYGIGVFLGFRSAFSWQWALVVPIILIIAPYFSKKIFDVGKENRTRIMFAAILGIVSFFVAFIVYDFPVVDDDGVTGKAHIDISSITLSKSHFGEAWVYRGAVRSFVADDNIIARNVPYIMYISKGKQRLSADRRYILDATISATEGMVYRLKPDLQGKWYPVPHSWSMAEYRLRAKGAVTSYLTRKLSRHRSASFLAGLATGEYHDRSTLFQLGRLGLQHIMAISGFHFAIIAALLALMLKAFFSLRVSSYILIALLSSYFVFIGCSPSIQRAWLSAVITIIGVLVGRPTYALNTIGIAMLAILSVSPLLCMNLGFQFSFLATIAIVSLYPPIEALLGNISATRPLGAMKKLPWYEQWGYLVVAFLKKACAVTIAVHIVSAPMMLLYFHKFPLLGILFNIFFPFLVSIAIAALLVTMLIDLVIPAVAAMFFSAIDVYTAAIIDFAVAVPATMNFAIRTQAISPTLFTVYLCLIAIIAIISYDTTETTKQQWQFI